MHVSESLQSIWVSRFEDLVNSQAYESMENVTVEMDLGEVVLFGSMQACLWNMFDIARCCHVWSCLRSQSWISGYEMAMPWAVMNFSWQVLARVSVQYEPMLENLVGTLFLSPTGIPALTKASDVSPTDLHGICVEGTPDSRSCSSSFCCRQTLISFRRTTWPMVQIHAANDVLVGEVNAAIAAEAVTAAQANLRVTIPYWYSTLLYKISIYI